MKKSRRDVKGNTPVAVLEDVGRSFEGRPVLSDINITISHGEMLGVIGPNGGGKSTLLLLMAGLLRPTEGSVSVNGIDAYSLSLSAAGSVGLVTARPGLYPLLSGRENLHHFGGLFGLSKGQVDEKSEGLIKTLGLEGAADLRVEKMSTGMRQKISLIRALLLSPHLLLLDEPTANLDPLASSHLYSEIRKRADEGEASVLVTHDLAAAESICDRVLLVDGSVKREIAFTKKRAPLAGPLYEAWKEEVIEG